MGVLIQIPRTTPPAERLLGGFTRSQLAGFIEVAIALLDAADGDEDLEDDDPSGDPLDERGEHPTDTAQVLLPTRPRYGVDQTKGPINEREAHWAWQRSMLREEFR